MSKQIKATFEELFVPEFENFVRIVRIINVLQAISHEYSSAVARFLFQRLPLDPFMCTVFLGVCVHDTID